MNSEGAKKEDLRLYLLGLSSAEEQQAIEERLITNRSDYDEVLIAEEELIDDYLANKLSETEQQAFNTHFMNPPERHGDLRFAQALKTYISANDADVIDSETTKPELTRSVPKTEPHFFGGRFPVPAFSLGVPLAVVTVLLLGVLLWIGYRSLTPHGAPQIAVTLSGGAVTREGGSVQTVTLPAGEISVQFSLPVPPAPFQVYQAVLRDAEGNVILTGQRSTLPSATADRKIVVNVPGRSLSNGDYQFVLNGIDEKGDSESVASYRFKVVR